MRASERKRVAVVGAGVSGLTAAKCLIDAGLEPVVFEAGAELGGIWRYDETLPEGGGPAYRGLRTNTTKQETAFSDFPFPAHLPDHPPRAEVLRYLQAYAGRFDLCRRIRFRTEVSRINPAGAGRWTVETCSPAGRRVETYDAVVVGSGIFRDPVLPALPGLDTFAGTIMHSRAYMAPHDFAGQAVLVVGGGSSATDVAVEASAVARHVYVSVRGMALGKDGPDQATPRRLRAALDRILSPVARDRLVRHASLVWSGRLPRRGRVAPDAPFVLGTAPFVPNPKLRTPLAQGTVSLKPGIAHVDRDCVAFVDGSHAKINTIVFATGYALSFPFLATSIFSAAMDGLDLYRLVFPPEWPTLAFVGLFRVSGPAPPVAEMQARWATGVFTGAVRLPSAGQMWAEIAARREQIARTGGNPFRLNAAAYEDLLARELDVLPRFWRHPTLVRPILAGPHVAAQYRLDGPGRWPGAAQAILDAPT